MAKSKTGLAENLRIWLRKQKNPFSAETAFLALQKKGYQMQTIKWTLRSFLRRNEVTRNADGLFVYSRGYHTQPFESPIRDRILKAIYVANKPFTALDIQRFTGFESRSYTAHLLPALTRKGYLIMVREKNPRMYRLLNRERFRLELFKN